MEGAAGDCGGRPWLFGTNVSGRRPFGGRRLDAALGAGTRAVGAGAGLGGGWLLCEVLSRSIGPPFGGGGGLGVVGCCVRFCPHPFDLHSVGALSSCVTPWTSMWTKAWASVWTRGLGLGLMIDGPGPWFHDVPGGCPLCGGPPPHPPPPGFLWGIGPEPPGGGCPLLVVVVLFLAVERQVDPPLQVLLAFRAPGGLGSPGCLGAPGSLG
jgi:hypothetical protein